jgi:endonuclease III
VCDARSPRCDACVVNDLCPASRISTARSSGAIIGKA